MRKLFTKPVSLLFLCLVCLFSGIAYSQTLSQYTLTASTGTYTPLAGGTVLSWNVSSDDGYYAVTPMGFTFNYCGNAYTYFSASTNGAFVLGTSSMTYSSTTTHPYLASTTPRPILCADCGDQMMDVGTFSYKLTGTSPNRIFIAEWLNQKMYYTDASPDISYQVILYENSGKIQFIYRQEAGTPGASVNYSCGISDAASNIFISLANTTSSPSSSMSTETTNITGRPNSGQIFTFALPSLTGLDVAITSIDSPLVWKPGNNYLTVRYQNAKTDSIKWVYLGYSKDGSAISNVRDSISKKLGHALGTNAYRQFRFPAPVNVTAGSHTFKVWVTKPNDSFPDNIRANDTLTQTICTAMAGNYTIGSSGNFTTFGAAVTAMTTCGIYAPVTFTVSPGTYNERVVIPPIPGSSAINTITFNGVNKTATILTYTATSMLSTVLLNGANYVRFNNMTIQNLGTSYGRAIYFTNNASYDKISNCMIIVSKTVVSSYFLGIESGSSETTIETTGNNANYDSIINNDIGGGYFGIMFFGTGYSTWTFNNVIKGNNFHDQYNSAIFAYYQRNLIIQRNTINIGSRNNTAYGIYDYYCDQSWIDGNTINPGEYGIYLQYENDYNGVDSTVIINNMISNFANASYQVGLYGYYYNYNLRILHNSIWVNGSTNTNYSYAALSFLYPYNLVIRNNILTSTGGTMLIGIYYYPYGNLAIIEGNIYYYPNRAYPMFFNYSTYYNALADWRGSSLGLTSPHDVTCVDNVNPNFISSTNLHLNNNFPPLKVIPQWVLWDVDGDTRCKFETAIGADEPAYKNGKRPVAGFYSDDTLCLSTPITFTNYASPTDREAQSWYLNRVFQTHNLNYTNSFPTVGLDTIMLISENCYGKDTFTKVVSVNSPLIAPHADFITLKNTAEVMDYITLNDLSTGCPSGWQWDIYPDTVYDPAQLAMEPTYEFASGSSATSQNPKLWFDYPGKYEVCLTASNVKGSSPRLCKKNYIEINATGIMCIPPYGASTLSGVLNDDFEGEGYQASTVDYLCYYIINTCADTLTFTFNEFNVKTGDYFRIYMGLDNTGKPLWNRTLFPLGMGNGMTMTSANFQDTFTSTNGQIYIEWFRHGMGTGAPFYNPGGFLGQWTAHKVSVPAPVAKFTSPDTACMNQVIYFKNKTTGFNPTYVWILDPLQAPGTTKDTSWTFTSPGVYQVKLTASNCGGDSTFVKNIVVIQPSKAPIPNFYTDLRFPLKGVDVVNLIDSSKGCVDNWSWKISPMTYTNIGGTLHSSTINIRFEDTGCYNITLVAGFNGYYDSITKVCYIHAIDYCIPKVTNLNSDLGISYVSISTLNNSTSIGLSGYADYTTTQSVMLDKRATYQLTIGRNTAFNPMNRKVWIDWNINGNFTDAGELVGYENSANTLTWTINLTIPATAKAGTTRMRIGTSLGSMPNTPCGPNTYGEFEDYRLVIRDDATPPVITLKGKDTVYINQCAVYVDSGAVAIDNVNGNLTAFIKVTNGVNTKKYGTYYVKYDVSDSNGNKAIEGVRTVIVNPDKTPPVLTMAGKSDTILLVNSIWNDPGCTATDICGGLSGSVLISGIVKTSVLGDYKLTYTAKDSNNNVASITRMVHVRDNIAPAIVLNGVTPMTCAVYNKFVDPGVTLSDNFDPNPILIISGKVDTAHVGTDTISYSAEDHSGNVSITIKRIVNVIDTIKPVVTAPGYGDTLTVEVKNYLSEPVLKITDNYYKTFTKTTTGSFIKNFPTLKATALGTFKLVYHITDGSGNKDSISFVVLVVDREKPVVKLIGAYTINLCRFDVLKPSEDSVAVTDNYDNSPVLTRSGSYITDYLVNKENGIFSLIYTATDGSGNVSIPAERLVNVSECGSGISTSANGKVEIYPNPNKGSFDILIDMPVQGRIKISVVNLLGEVIKDAEVSSGKAIYHMELGSISQGIYMVKVQSANISLIKKITVTK